MLSIQPSWNAACSSSREDIQPRGKLAGATKEAPQRDTQTRREEIKVVKKPPDKK
jgi:hypothetical protein